MTNENEAITLLDEGQVEERTGGSLRKKTLQQWRWRFGATGKLIGPPWIKAGARVLYDLRDLERWLQNQRVCEADHAE